jgi:hypothetical protein
VDGPKGAVWQGWPLHMQLHCERGAGGRWELAIALAVEPPCATAVALITDTCEAVAAGGGTSITDTCAPSLYTRDNTSWCDKAFFGLGNAGGGAGPPKDWAGVEAALRAKRLVHGGRGAAHLKLRCTVSRLE